MYDSYKNRNDDTERIQSYAYSEVEIIQSNILRGSRKRINCCLLGSDGFQRLASKTRPNRAQEEKMATTITKDEGKEYSPYFKIVVSRIWTERGREGCSNTGGENERILRSDNN